MKELDLKQLEQELKKLPREQVVQFAWRCGMRVLPFLGAEANFNFWDEKNRQQHLYAVFHSLDRAAAPATAVTAIASAAASAATAATAAYAVDATAAAYATAAATTAAYATTAAAYATAAAARRYDKEQEMVAAIWHDLEAAQGKTTSPLSVDLYGDVWENFQQALAAEGCAWWGRLYQKIFDDELVLSYEALERRLNIPEEIR